MTNQHDNLRIACLEPAATEVCLALGLASSIVGVTHECKLERIRQALQSETTSKENAGDEPLGLYILTKSGLNEGASQAEIHKAVDEEGKRRMQAEADFDDDANDSSCCEYPVSSLYPLVPGEWNHARPTLIFTQDLCAVCAPTPLDVERVTKQHSSQNNDRKHASPTVVSLQPKTLTEVAETFVTVADHCFPRNILESSNHPGKELKDVFWKDIANLQSAIEKHRSQFLPKPRMLMLEWLDPPFSGGHWVHAMMEYACVESAMPTKKAGSIKSPRISWADVAASDPDAILVGCCGFSLPRNIEDTKAAAHQFLALRAGKNNTIFACDGDSYFAQPTQLLLHGIVILAMCGYKDQPNVLQAIEECCQSFSTPFMPPSSLIGWERVALTQQSNDSAQTPKAKKYRSSKELEDIEDIGASTSSLDGFYALHKRACEEGNTTYIDPSSGYQVFTEVTHLQRGKCCGSGCRHCPFSHVNVKDKLSRIQQPAMLYQAATTDASLLFACQSKTSNQSVKVLFFSGGKDSFLTIRALVRQHYQDNPFGPGLVLLTTFDVQSRTIAHQEVSIEDIVRQAKHLQISLLGVPLHRSSGQSYVDVITGALKVLDRELQVTSLVFGDLHLEHIKEWRESALGVLGYKLEFPLWNVPYDTLMDDLEASGVPCVVSGTTCDDVCVGTLFDRKFFNSMSSKNAPQIKSDNGGGEVMRRIDAFGERGEFHSLAEVWAVSRERALGLVIE